VDNGLFFWCNHSQQEERRKKKEERREKKEERRKKKEERIKKKEERRKKKEERRKKKEERTLTFYLFYSHIIGLRITVVIPHPVRN